MYQLNILAHDGTHYYAVITLLTRRTCNTIKINAH